MEIVLALDIGKARTGIARSDAMGIIIKPLKTIKTMDLIYELETISEEYSLNKIVVGMPVNIEGGNKDATTMVEAQVKNIRASFPNAEIIFENESFSSKEAEGILKAKGIRIDKDNKEILDSYAAAVILEQYFRGNSKL